jgi:deoxyhypusine synthase
MLYQDMEMPETPFAFVKFQILQQGTVLICDVPNEKITWENWISKPPKFIIESDATIVAPPILLTY